MSGFPKIRPMQEQDLPRVVELSHQLGYLESTLDSVSTNFHLGRTLESHEYYVLVEDNYVAAWMNLLLRVRLEAPPFLQVAALVVCSKFRSQGLGRMLLAFAEERARAHGLHSVGMLSSAPRLGAHQFYLRAGYEKAKENYFFQKELT